MLICPVSSDDAVRISFTSRSSMSQLFLMICIDSFFSSDVVSIESTSEKPTMALMGVRISCVMLARKRLFALPDSLARWVSWRSRSCLCIRSLMFRHTPKAPNSRPSLSYSGMQLICTHCGPVLLWVTFGYISPI